MNCKVRAKAIEIRRQEQSAAMIKYALHAERRADEKAGADLWQSGQHRQISHTRGRCIQAQHASPCDKAIMA